VVTVVVAGVEGLSVGEYVVGVLWLVALVGVLAYGAIAVRARLLPTWVGVEGRLAEVVVALATVIGVAELLGGVGIFGRSSMLLSCAVVALGMRVWAGRASGEARAQPGTGDAADETQTRSPGIEKFGAIAAAAIVGAQWFAHVAWTYGRGITQGDSLWYHATFAARFVQSGRVTDWGHNNLADLGMPLHSVFPLNGSLVQAVAMLPFHSDLLSPLVNVGWAALAVLAAVCMGRRNGGAALAALAGILFLGVPTISGTQPGQAANDIATTALFLAATALLLEGRLARTPTALAGIAAGLALGTKLTVAVPVAVLTIGIVVLGVRTRRFVAAAYWIAATVIAGGYWFVRNWIVFHNPLPWTTLHLGPVTLTRTVEVRPGLASYLGSWNVWRTDVFPALMPTLGRVWPAVLALGLAGAIIAVVRGSGIERICGLAAIAGVIAVFFIQEGSDFFGAAFVFMVRYFVPSLLLGAVLLVRATVAAPTSTAWRRALLVVMFATVVIDTTTSYKYESAAWPPGEWIPGVLVVIAIAVFAVAMSRRTTLRRLKPLGIALAAVAVCVIVGWPLQRHYFGDRYVHAGLPHDDVNAMFQDVRNAKVEVLGTEHFYPLFGRDLSNDIGRKVVASADADCTHWRQLLNDQHYRYIVIAHDDLSLGIANEAWVSTDPGVTEVLHAGDATVYEVVHPLDPNTCA
jgi:hypothetical protein